MGADTMKAMEARIVRWPADRCGILPVRARAFDMYKIDRPISFNSSPCRGRSARRTSHRSAKMKVHVHPPSPAL
jgi:hypothetical protein